MKPDSLPIRPQSGFTLLEVVITLIVASILGAILIQFMGTSMQQSYEPVYLVQEGYSVNQVLENLNAEYKRLLFTSTTPLEDFKTLVENANTPPDPYFGDYTYQTGWIAFDGSGNEVASADHQILKIKITFGQQSLTALFTR